MDRWKLALIASLVLPAANASAYAIKTAPSGAAVHWDRGSVTFTPVLSPGPADVSPDAALAALRASSVTWNAAGGIDVVIGDPVAAAASETDGNVRALATWQSSLAGLDGEPDVDAAGQRESDGLNTVRWALSKNDPDIEAGVVALTFSAFSKTDGVLTETDIVVNAFNFQWSTSENGCSGQQDLESAFTHEIGHALGLAHSADANATMFATASKCETKKRDLADDDKTAIAMLYPAGCSAGSAGGTGGAAMLIMAMAVGMRRRRRGAALATSLVAVTIVAPSTVGAATLHQIELAKLAQDAVLVVRGTVQSETVTPSGRIETDVEISVEECLGESVACPATVSVRRRGGERGDKAVSVDSEAIPQIGSEVVMYLRVDARGAFRALGGIQGMLRVVPVGSRTFAVRDLRGHDTLVDGTWRMDHVDVVELFTLRAHVSKQRGSKR